MIQYYFVTVLCVWALSYEPMMQWRRRQKQEQ